MIKDIRIENNVEIDLYTWIEICDKCGETIYNHNSKCSEYPDENAAHFCHDCVKYFLNEGISYEESFSIYKKLDYACSVNYLNPSPQYVIRYGDIIINKNCTDNTKIKIIEWDGILYYYESVNDTVTEFRKIGRI